MPLARINGRLLFFVHIPKTAGASIETYMAQKGTLAFISVRNSRWSRSNPQHAQAEIVEAFFPSEFYDMGFCVIRDPLNRLQSEFQWRSRKAKNMGWVENRLRSPVQTRLPEWLRRQIDAAVFFGDFDTWVRRMFMTVRWNRYYNDNHMRPQSEFVVPGHKVFLYEDGLSQVFDWIDASTGTDLAPRDIHLHKAASPKPEAKESTLKLIRAFYKEDYELIKVLKQIRDGL